MSVHMNSKDRILNALSFKSVDIPGLRIDVSPRGLYEHGEKLRDLLKTVVGDFGPISDMPIPVPDAKAVDEHGEYLEYITDEWGVEWQYRIFKMAGHPHKRPLDDWNAFANYIPPKNPYPAKGTAAFEALKNNLMRLFIDTANVDILVVLKLLSNEKIDFKSI